MSRRIDGVSPEPTYEHEHSPILGGSRAAMPHVDLPTPGTISNESELRAIESAQQVLNEARRQSERAAEEEARSARNEAIRSWQESTQYVDPANPRERDQGLIARLKSWFQ